jgi:hypothetical protein
MNEQDLRDCFAMFALPTLLEKYGMNAAVYAYEVADMMLKARKPAEEGIVAIKRKVKAK